MSPELSLLLVQEEKETRGKQIERSITGTQRFIIYQHNILTSLRISYHFLIDYFLGIFLPLKKYDWQPANPVPSNTFLTLPLSNQQGGLLETNKYVSRQRKEEPVYGNVPSASRLALARSHKAAR